MGPPGSFRTSSSGTLNSLRPAARRPLLADMPVIVRHQDQGALRLDHRHDQALCRRRSVIFEHRHNAAMSARLVPWLHDSDGGDGDVLVSGYQSHIAWVAGHD